MRRLDAPRVCIIRRAYYPAESHVRRNAESLLAAGYAVDVVCLRKAGEAASEVVDGVTVHRLPLQARRGRLLGYLLEYAAFFVLALLAVTRLHIRHRLAVVEADSMPDILVFAGILPRLTGAHLILYLFESMPEIWAQRRGLPMTHWSIRLLCWQERISCRFAEVVICCHEMAQSALVGRGVSAGKITVILNVPDERVFRQRWSSARGRDGLFHLVQHGTITVNYGLQVVLQALKLAGPGLPLHFDVVGDGEHRPVLEAMARDLAVEDRVTFHGFVSRERLLELLEQADAGVVPMLFEYQSPNKMFELVGLGIPVLASDRKTFSQHFPSGEVSYFCTGDPRDLARIIEEAYRHPRRMKQQAARALERYEGYRWQVMRERYLGVYRRVLESTRKEGAAPMSWPKQVLQTRGLTNATARLGTVGSRLGPTPRRITACLDQFLRITEEYGCSPTLAITARVLARHPDLGRMLADRGAEVAVHGYVHTNYTRLPYERQLKHLLQARDIFDRCGIPHRGFRAPYLFWNTDTLRAVAAARLAYDSSSLVGWDVVDEEMALEKGWRWDEYQHLIALHRPQDAAEALSLPSWVQGIVEIPGSYPDDESLVDWLAVSQAEDVAEIWLTALGQACKREELFTLQLHHERIAFCRPALEAVLERARTGRPAAWVATLGEIADWWRERQEFSWQRTRGESGHYTMRLVASPRASILFKGVPPASMQTRSWAGAWRRVKGQVVSLPAGKRPVVGVPERAPKALISFLQGEGYIVEVGRKARQALYLEGYARFRPQDARRVLAEIESCPGPLVRFSRWPDAARGALAVTGDIDAVTWWDFCWRLVEC